MAASRSASASIRSARRTSRRPRWLAFIARQGPPRKALLAAPTAASTSLESQRGIRAQGLPVKGSKLSKNARASVFWPPIVFWKVVKSLIACRPSVHRETQMLAKAVLEEHAIAGRQGAGRAAGRNPDGGK